MNRPTDVLTGLAAGGAVAAMVATPLLPPAGSGRRILSSVVIGGLFTTSATRSARRWGGVRAGLAAGAVTALTAAAERVGTATGFPFGRYRYTDALQPQLFHVPVIVPLAWFAMAPPAREVARAAVGPRAGRATRLLAGSAALTAWDLFLDPQMTAEGYWAWQRVGRYRGIPLTNFVGWFATGVAVMAVLDALLPPTADPDPALVGQYTYMGVMETVGFARYFRDPLVALVGAAGMLPFAALATIRLAAPRA